jgi:hypothetical protein
VKKEKPVEKKKERKKEFEKGVVKWVQFSVCSSIFHF